MYRDKTYMYRDKTYMYRDKMYMYRDKTYMYRDKTYMYRDKTYMYICYTCSLRVTLKNDARRSAEWPMTSLLENSATPGSWAHEPRAQNGRHKIKIILMQKVPQLKFQGKHSSTTRCKNTIKNKRCKEKQSKELSI